MVRTKVCRKLNGNNNGVWRIYTQFQQPRVKKQKTMMIKNNNDIKNYVQPKNCWQSERPETAVNQKMPAKTFFSGNFFDF